MNSTINGSNETPACNPNQLYHNINNYQQTFPQSTNNTINNTINNTSVNPNSSFIFQNENTNEEDLSDSTNTKEPRDRRKIKIEYIKDKSRRHITFSKRKAGIMKKAYELSTLTGTQILLLVVSETGLVYTFTTPKLQALVTRPEGKSLIQSCLNTPEQTAAAAAVELESQRAAAAAAAASHYQLYEMQHSQQGLNYDLGKGHNESGKIAQMSNAAMPNYGSAASVMARYGYGNTYEASGIPSPTPLSINTNINSIYAPSQISPYSTHTSFPKTPLTSSKPEYWNSNMTPLPSPGIKQMQQGNVQIQNSINGATN